MRNKVSLKDLYFGMSSAEAEAAADPDLFLRTYYDLDFRSYAAARAQACWTSRISSVVAGRGDVGRNRAAMIWRRRLVSMSRVAGSVFDPYHGADARRCATSVLGWPWRWYQRMSRL